MKIPNYNRKYKKKFYILLVIGIVCCLSFIVNPIAEKIATNTESSMVEGQDYTIESFKVENKNVYKHVDLTIWDFYPYYTRGIVTEIYFLTNGEKKVIAEQEDYNTANIGDTISVYKTNDGKLYTSLTRARRESFSTALESLMIVTIIFPVLGLLLLIYLFVLRKTLINPYYKGV